MTNKYYALSVASESALHAAIKAALLDYYGAYADPGNLTGVAFLYDTSPELIFTCTAIADKPLMVDCDDGGRCRWLYGSGYTSGAVLDDPVYFAGSYNTGTPTEAHLSLGAHTLLMTVLLTTIGSRLAVVGQLSNGDYAVLGAIGNSNHTYNAGAIGYNTTDSVNLYPVTFDAGFQSTAGLLYKQDLILSRGATGVELNTDGSIASFQDLQNAAYDSGSNIVEVWGATFVLTMCDMYMASALNVLPTSLLMEYDEVV